jgi:hypothetical protein
LTVIFCEESSSQEAKVDNEPRETSTAAIKTALSFINKYVDYCNDLNPEITLKDWIDEQSQVTEQFKKELKRTIAKADQQEPQLGIGADPIFDAQDYPENGFEVDTSHKESDLIRVQGKEWKDFKLNIKMTLKNGQWFVNGIGMINMSENERFER